MPSLILFKKTFSKIALETLKLHFSMESFSKDQNAHMIVNADKSMTIKPKIMQLNQDDMNVSVEKIVDLESFSQKGYNLWRFFRI